MSAAHHAQRKGGRVEGDNMEVHEVAYDYVELGEKCTTTARFILLHEAASFTAGRTHGGKPAVVATSMRSFEWCARRGLRATTYRMRRCSDAAE